MRRVVQLVKDVVQGKPKHLRSPRWDDVRDAHIKKHPTCAACGSTTHLQVHHIKPFHLFRELELEPSNLLTLCEQSDTKCHFRIGHNGSWRKYNEHVIQEAAEALANRAKIGLRSV
jgi:5-methylcytosine-specific restriction endonuclease McrA